MKNKAKYSVIALILIVIIGFGGWFGYQHLSTTKHVAKRRPQPVNITAVGDSLTQGVGDPNNRGGYVYMINKKIKSNHPDIKVTTANFGIAGETSTQIDARVNKKQRLQKNLKQSNVIVMTFGGNDLMQFLRKNAMLSNNVTMKSRLKTFETDYSSRVQKLIGDVRRQNPDAKIFVFGIYNPVYVYLPQVKLIGQAVSDTNKVTQNVIKNQNNAYFVSIDKEISDGQYQSRSQQNRLEKQAGSKMDFSGKLSDAEILALFGGNGSNQNDLISTTDHFHPNKHGYEIMTDKLYKVMSTQIAELRR
ncbi:GDSL-type esterase/lipase family protein [Lentilactobacillus sp. SPB1-3]|uniref:GDSL-type esterase/lipase family protein n=1 Tax=Lentilactobacillus terminaliae TaxID=3003483 RepID=A0ACD5DC94_9LACO|nr:GDSL-type esterase/lipase family protein [Lentilactobacillus sp. SPB1-3]MCZ0977241.1 GDSL-type esterase/lipase family protein [Lentilactobacillus sp. SPB1-3]